MRSTKILAVIVFLLCCTGWAEDCSANSGDKSCNCESINSHVERSAAIDELIQLQTKGKLSVDANVIEDLKDIKVKLERREEAAWLIPVISLLLL